MKEIKLKGHKVELFDDIESLPIVRFHKYNKMLLIDSGCGSDISDFDQILEKAIRFTAVGKSKEAIDELQNLRQNVYFVHTQLSPKFMAFAALVASIDGKPCDDISDEGLKRVLEKLSDVPVGSLSNTLDEVKKKIDQSLNAYFPSTFDDARLKEYYDMLKRRTIKVLESIVNHEDYTEEVDSMTDDLLTYFKPKVFRGMDNIEIRQDKQFSKMCLILSHNLHCNPKDMTTMEYYNAFEYLKEVQRKKRRNGK